MYLYTENLGIPLFPIGIIILLISLIILWKRKHSFSYFFFFLLFWVYLMFSIEKVFFPLEISGPFVDEMKQVSISSLINFTPFFLDFSSVKIGEVKLFLYNIILTIPFGFGLNFLTRVRSKNIFAMSVILGASLEITQLFISIILGYPYRTVDVNDLLFNTIGVLVGYGLFKLIAGLYLMIDDQTGVMKKGLLLYLDNVVHQKEDIY